MWCGTMRREQGLSITGETWYWELWSRVQGVRPLSFALTVSPRLTVRSHTLVTHYESPQRYSIHLPTSRAVAIKQIDLESSSDEITEIQLEIAHLMDCDSEWITRYYGSFMKGWKLWIGECGSRSGKAGED